MTLPAQEKSLDRIQHRILYQEAANRIRELIEHGALVAGEKISEKQLCEKFGISRTPLREALKVLTSEGLVEILPNRGARVSRLTLSDVEHTYDVMGALEGLAGETACRHLTDEELAHVCDLHEQMLGHYRRRNCRPISKPTSRSTNASCRPRATPSCWRCTTISASGSKGSATPWK